MGSHSVKIVEMAIDRGGMRLVRAVGEDLELPPDALPGDRNAAMANAVRNIVKTHKISTKNAVFCIPGQTVFVRQGVRVPKATPAKLHQIIHFEARQLIPFPLEQTMVEYQVFETEEERELEVLLVAMKKETNQDFMRLVKRTGLRVMALSVSSLALFNGQELQNVNIDARLGEKRGGGGFPGLRKSGKSADGAGKKKKRSKKGEKEEAGEELSAEDAEAELQELMGEDYAVDDAGFEEVRAYVNIGDRATDLAITKPVEREGVGFTRSIPLGGSHITNAVFKACGCESFHQAEEIKRERTAVLSGVYEFEADKSRYDEAASQAATQVCDRIVAELRRSLDFFISQPDGAAVDAVVLSGGGSKTAYLASYLEERLGVPVETPHELGNKQIKRPPEYDGEDFDFAPYRIALGLAAQGLGLTPIEANFLPTDVRSMRDFGSQHVEIAALAAMVAVIVFFGQGVGGSQIAEMERQLQQLEQKRQRVAPLIKRRDAFVDYRNAVLEKSSQVGEEFVDRDFWLQTLAFIHSAKPPEVLVTDVNLRADYYEPSQGTVRLLGEAEQETAITQFIDDLKKNSERVKEATLVENPRRASRHFNQPVYHYTIEMKVAKPDEGRVTRLMPEAPPAPEQ